MHFVLYLFARYNVYGNSVTKDIMKSIKDTYHHTGCALNQLALSNPTEVAASVMNHCFAGFAFTAHWGKLDIVRLPDKDGMYEEVLPLHIDITFERSIDDIVKTIVCPLKEWYAAYRPHWVQRTSNKKYVYAHIDYHPICESTK